MRAGRAGPHNKTVPANTAADAQLTLARNSPQTPLAGWAERAQVAKQEQSEVMDIKYGILHWLTRKGLILRSDPLNKKIN